MCTYDDADDKKPWCSTKVYENGTHIQRIGAWGHCAAHRCQKVDAGKVKSVILYYDMTTLVADVGGYIGMLLGVSLVDLTIMCNAVFSKVVKLKNNDL